MIFSFSVLSLFSLSFFFFFSLSLSLSISRLIYLSILLLDDEWPSSWVDLMTECWAEDPSVRPSFSEIIRILEVLPTDASAFENHSLSSAFGDSSDDDQLDHHHHRGGGGGGGGSEGGGSENDDGNGVLDSTTAALSTSVPIEATPPFMHFPGSHPQQL